VQLRLQAIVFMDGTRASPRVGLVILARGLLALAMAMANRGPTLADGEAPRVEERKPEIYYLEDDAGGLVPVPGFRYRDFVELFRLKEGLPVPAQPPAAVLEEIRLSADLGAATDGTCPATVTCIISQSRRGWVHVPLGCQGLIIDRGPEHEGAGRLVVDAEADGRGYRAWLDAAPEQGKELRHTVTLGGRLAVDESESRSSLVLHLPPATTSAVELRSPRGDPQVVVQPPAAAQQVRPADGGAMVTLFGVAGTTTVSVADRAAGVVGQGPVAEAAVESVVRIDGREAVTQARVRLVNLAEATPTVRITLPPETTLRSVRPPAAVVAQGGTPEAPTVDVTVVRGPDGGALVEMECHRSLERAPGPWVTAPTEVVGFAIEGIEPWRQSGRISLVTDGDWLLRSMQDLRRVDPPAGRRPGLVAAFAYETLPASLRVQVRPRPSRVVIEPEYRYDVSRERVALHARLRVAASGPPAPGITVDFDPSWVIEDIGPAGVVDVAGVTAEAGKLFIPFAPPLTGNAVVEIRGGMAIERDADRLAWRLPLQRSPLVGAATVVVAADSDIELLPDNDRISGLVRQSAAGLSRPGMDDVVLAYRLDALQGQFAATRRYLPRRVDATVAVQAVVDEAATAVTETMRLTVMHVPLEFIELLVPEAVVAAGAIEARQDDWLLDLVEIAEAPDAPVDSGTRRLRAILPTQLLGTGAIVVRYTLPTPSVNPETTVAHDLPLVLPDGALITRQTLVLESPDRFAVEVRGEGWRRDASPQPADGSRSWSTIRRQDVVPLAVAARRRSAAGRLAIDAALLRTTVFPDRREDLFTYAISGAAERVEFALPFADGDIRLDGQPVAAATRTGGTVQVDLPGGGPGRWLLEVRRVSGRTDGWTGFASRWGLPAPLPLASPTFGAGASPGRFFWEIVARNDEWLVGAPAAWTAQEHWAWSGLFPERVAVVSPEGLRAWVQAAAGTTAAPRGADEPAMVVRRAVYAGLGQPQAATPWLVPVWSLVLACSGTTLLVGLACLRWAAVRRPAVLLAIAGVVTLAAAAFPDAAPLAAIAAAPGGLLVGLGWLLERLGDRRRAGVAAAMPAASSLTRAVAPSLVIGGAVVRGDSVGPSGRSAS
jgi:hypothetical protein